MPATSKAQQKFFGIVRSIQKGDAKASEFSKDAQDAAKRISKSDVKKYAKTKHSGLPKKVKMEILRRLKEASDGWASPPYSHMDSKKREHDDDNNLGKKKKHSGQPDLEESRFSKKPEVTPQQLSKIQSDVRKINRKIKVYISKHPVTKGELSIELGAGHDNDSEIDKIYKVLKKHTGTHRTGTMFNEGGKELSDKNYADYKRDNEREVEALIREIARAMTLKEIGMFPISNYMSGIIPGKFFDTTTKQKKERFRAVVKDLVNTLNYFWKQHKIPYRVRDIRRGDKPRGLKETETKRDYKKEYKKFQSSKKAKKYRAELNKYNRDKGTYGNGDGKDASHKGGKIVGFESASKNRGRAEKSRLKKNK